MRIEQIIVFLLLMTGAVGAVAGTDGPERGMPDTARAYSPGNSPGNSTLASGAQSVGLPSQQAVHGRGFSLPDTSDYYAQGDTVSVRVPGRMSAEERRMLRQQIDEVGHDIYFPNADR